MINWINKLAVNIYSWASPMIKVRHGRDAKRRVYDELLSLEEPMNKFIMQLDNFQAFQS